MNDWEALFGKPVELPIYLGLRKPTWRERLREWLGWPPLKSPRPGDNL